MPSVYRRLLGEKLDAWPSALRALHDVDKECSFTGTFKITRGRGWLRRFVCWMAGMPPSGEAVPIHLRVVPEGDKERWIRRFGEHQLESVQWLHQGDLMEKLGPATIAYHIEVNERTFRMVPKKVWLFGWIRIPLFLAPKGVGYEVGTNDTVDVEVRVTAPLLGEVIRYEGQIRVGEQ